MDLLISENDLLRPKGGADDSASLMDPDSRKYNRNWTMTVFVSVALSLCLAVDILQYSVPLPFLPQILEGQGYSSALVSIAMGSYYVAGCLGGTCICWYYIVSVLSSSERTSWTRNVWHVTRLISILMGALLLSVACVVVEGLYDHYRTHLICRTLEGFFGSFLFVFVYLLTVELFKGSRRIFALTLSSIVLNMSEIGGPMAGAVLFTYVNQQAVFFSLATLSFLTQVLLVGVLVSVHRGSFLSESQSGSTSGMLQDDVTMVAMTEMSPRNDPLQGDRLKSISTMSNSLRRVLAILNAGSLWKSVLVIGAAAMVKSHIESTLPLFAAHTLSLDPLDIGIAFSVISVTFAASSIGIGIYWSSVATSGGSKFKRNTPIIIGLLLLMGVSYALIPVVQASESTYALLSCTAVYGVGLGLTITPATYMLGDAVDGLDDLPSKALANAIWNTLWECAGSIGVYLSSQSQVSTNPLQDSSLIAVGINVLACCAILIAT